MMYTGANINVDKHKQLIVLSPPDGQIVIADRSNQMGLSKIYLWKASQTIFWTIYSHISFEMLLNHIGL